jgi:hypothetical protein
MNLFDLQNHSLKLGTPIASQIMLILVITLGLGTVACESKPESNNSTSNPTETPTASNNIVPDASIVVDQAKKAKESEGKIYIGSMSRGQQAYFLEKNKFAQSIDELQLGIKSDSATYTYKIESASAAQVVITATAKTPELKSFTGVVIVEKPNTSEGITKSFLCGTETASTTPPPITDKVTAAKFQCPTGSTKL